MFSPGGFPSSFSLNILPGSVVAGSFRTQGFLPLRDAPRTSTSYKEIISFI